MLHTDDRAYLDPSLDSVDTKLKALGLMIT